ncbi:MAG: hypothetical protein AAF664_00755 [Planctomycetota bacterium]
MNHNDELPADFRRRFIRGFLWTAAAILVLSLLIGLFPAVGRVKDLLWITAIGMATILAPVLGVLGGMLAVRRR